MHYYTPAYFESKRREKIAAVSFGFFLAACFLLLLLTVLTTTGPVVLGTEMNANGLVEYLCLGNGCENKTALRWSDQARF